MFRCVGCKYNNDCTKVSRIEMENCTEYCPLTNADRVRSMTDEELAKWLNDRQAKTWYYGTWSKDAWLDWLKQEVDI